MQLTEDYIGKRQNNEATNFEIFSAKDVARYLQTSSQKMLTSKKIRCILIYP